MSIHWAVLIALLLTSVSHVTASSQTKAEAKFKLKAMSAENNAEQAAYMSSMQAIFKIIDPIYSKKVLEKAPDYSHYRDHVDDWIGDNQVRWKEVKANLDYCDSLLQAGHLGTAIDASIPDVRWELFIMNGPPANELVLPCECRGGSGACTIWTYVWRPTAGGTRGEEASCQSENGEDYPTKIVPADKDGFPLAGPLWPEINCSRFSTENGGADIWFSIWVPGDQFTRTTLDHAQLKMTAELYDSIGASPVCRDSSYVSLQIMRGILQATKREDRHLIMAMGYITFPNVRPGRYKAHLVVSGAPFNDGGRWQEVVIPNEIAISDLLLLEQSAGTGENMHPGIVRGGKGFLYDSPDASYPPGKLLGLYAEATLPGNGDWKYEVSVTLLPLPEVSRPNKSLITVGEAIVISDSLDQPFVNGEWQSPQSQEFLDSLVNAQSSSKSIAVFKKTFESKEAATIIQVSPRLSESLRSGQYMLTLTVSDPERQRYFMTSRRIIRVALARSFRY